MPERSIQTYLQSKDQKSQNPTNDLITAIILYHNDGYLTMMDSRVVQHKDFALAMRLTLDDLTNRAAIRGVEFNTLMTKYDLIRILLLSMENLAQELYNAAETGQQEEVFKMLLLWANIFTVENYNEVMTLAARGGHEEIVEMMLTRGANNYSRAMAEAGKYGHTDIVQLISKQGATYSSLGDFWAYNPQLSLGFLWLEDVAAIPERSIQTYLRFYDPKLPGKGDDLTNAMILYGKYGYLIPLDSKVVNHPKFVETMKLTPDQLIELLAANGVEVNTLMTKYDLVRMLLSTHLILDLELSKAAGQGKQRKVAKLLLIGNKIFTLGDYNGAMVAAAFNGKRETVEVMLAQGANDYNLAMEKAARNDHIEIVEMMLARGANDYNSAFGSAAAGGHRKIMERLLSIMAAKQITPDYDYAIELAARRNQYNIVKWLLELMAAQQILPKYGNTLLWAASRYPDGVETVKLLLERGANFLTSDDYSKAIAAARAYSDLEVEKLIREQQDRLGKK